MKNLFCLTLVSTCLCMGCTMEDVIEKGESCPPRQIANYQEIGLSYIATPDCTIDHPENCVLKHSPKNAEFYFSTLNCPIEFSECMPNDNDSNNYHCEKSKESSECEAPQIQCKTGNDKFKCIDPSSPRICGANDCDASDGLYGGQNCLLSNQSCELVDDKYVCVDKCEVTEMQCLINGEKKCFSSTDLEHCGTCDKDCNKLTYTNAHASECRKNDEDVLSCAFACDAGFDNCGTDYNPECTNLKTSQMHCGSCANECINGYCDNGICRPNACAETQCSLENDKGGFDCINNNEHCGPNCDNCPNIHDNAACENGVCVISGCLENEHPEYSGTKITKCTANSVQACAPANMKATETPVDCNETLPENGAKAECFPEGTCKLIACSEGFHLTSDGLSCEQNSESICAQAGSSSTINCLDFIPNSTSTTCTLDGSCLVIACKEGFHLSSDAKSCVESTPFKCATNDNSTEKDCTSIENIASSGDVSCTDGICQVSKCANGYHPNTDLRSCVKNAPTACADVSSVTTVDCSKNIANNAGVSFVSCDAGICKVSKCATGYHPSTDNKSCIQNTVTACVEAGSVISVDCTKSIANNAGASFVSCDAGICKVSKCAAGFHPAIDKKSCLKSSPTACAEVDSIIAVDCTQSIANNAGASFVSCDAGICKVSKCAAGFHLSTNKKSCVNNSATSCAPTDSSDAKNCQNGVEKVCNANGKCACSDDGSTVLNYDGLHCVNSVCQGLPGVKAGTLSQKSFYDNTPDYRCDVTQCESGYTHYKSVCLPNDLSSCEKMGYLNNSCHLYCTAYGSNSGCSGSTNSHNNCASDHREYRSACLPSIYCCGARNTNGRTSADFICKNCVAQGKTKCNVATGNCE